MQAHPVALLKLACRMRPAIKSVGASVTNDATDFILTVRQTLLLTLAFSWRDLAAELLHELDPLVVGQFPEPGI